MCIFDEPCSIWDALWNVETLTKASWKKHTIGNKNKSHFIKGMLWGKPFEPPVAFLNRKIYTIYLYYTIYYSMYTIYIYICIYTKYILYYI